MSQSEQQDGVTNHVQRSTPDRERDDDPGDRNDEPDETEDEMGAAAYGADYYDRRSVFRSRRQRRVRSQTYRPKWRVHPYLPGVVALGASRAAVAERIQEALTAYADDLRGRGQPVPAPHHATGTVAA
jgi:hypothetical protein